MNSELRVTVDMLLGIREFEFNNKLQYTLSTIVREIECVTQHISNLPHAQETKELLLELHSIINNMNLESTQKREKQSDDSYLEQNISELPKLRKRPERKIIHEFDEMTRYFNYRKIEFCNFDHTLVLVRLCSKIESSLITLAALQHKNTCKLPFSACCEC